MNRRFSSVLAMAILVIGCESGDGIFPAGSNFDRDEQPQEPEPVPCTKSTLYKDFDGDGFGDAKVTIQSCTPVTGFVANHDDCNDVASGIRPGASEQCDNVDNDCNGKVDDTTKSWYYDDDGDGYGNPASQLPGPCVGLSVKYVANGDDCKDTDASVNPNAKEDCDGIDSNCDGKTDTDIQITLYADLDLDGHGDGTKPLKACESSVGAVFLNDDCNDDLSKDGAKMFPGNPELCDLLDNDCNDLVDDGSDVKKTFFTDADGDGYGAPDKKVFACDAPVGATATGTDCNDNDKTVHPAAQEECDELDQNCNGVTDEFVQTPWRQDADGDGFAGPNSKITLACKAPPGMASGIGPLADCDDTDPDVYPGAPETCDGKDNACAGLPMPPKEPDALCEDKDPFTKDLCMGATGCVHDEQKLTLSCFNPPELPMSEGYNCSVSYFFGEPSASGKYEVTIGKDSVSFLMKDVCAQLQAGKTLRVNSAVFLDWDGMAAIWTGGLFTKLIDSFTNAAVLGVPGNVTIGTGGLDFNYTIEEISACQ